MSQDKTTKMRWGWNGDMCAVWGRAIILGKTRREKEATARLFSSAPEMRAELLRLRRWAERLGYVDTAERITKVLGEASGD